MGSTLEKSSPSAQLAGRFIEKFAQKLFKGRISRLALILLCLILFRPCISARGVEAGPAELNKAAYLLVHQAEKACYEKEERLAYDKYLEAIKAYEKIASRFPDWNKKVVRARIEQCRTRANALAEKIFQLPEGYLKIEPGMVREGKRYYQGQALAPAVKKIGENQYEVNDFTVSLAREGHLLGANCVCPDYKYRGSKYNYACRHIWAIILKEKLFFK